CRVAVSTADRKLEHMPEYLGSLYPLCSPGCSALERILMHSVPAYLSPSCLLLQPCRIEQQEGLVIERKVFHGGGPIRLEEGIRGHVHPFELIRQAALDVRTDRLGLLRLQRTAPLQHHRFALA